MRDEQGSMAGACMSGWIKWEKDLETDPRVLRMSRELKRMCNAGALQERSPAVFFVTLVCGSLVRLWAYADAHIREDDTIDLGFDALDDIIGIPGFCSLMPADWLKAIDDHTVELPNFQAHNGVEAKKKALNQKRVETHRKRKSITPALTTALPDQDQTKTRPRPKDKTTQSETPGESPEDAEARRLNYLDEESESDLPPPPHARLANGAGSAENAAGTFAVKVEAEWATTLRELGVKCTSMHPTLLAWIKAGYTLQQVVDAVAMARMSKPEPEPIPPNYLTPILEDAKRPKHTQAAEAHDMWQQVIAAVSRGAYSKSGFTLGERIDTAVRAIGGYSFLGRSTTRDNIFNEKKFRDALRGQVAA